MMARLQGSAGHPDEDHGGSRGLAELVVFGVVAFATILLIAVSSLSFEPRPVQPVSDGLAVPVHVVARTTG